MCIYFSAAASPQTTTASQSRTIVAATTAFLNSLSPAQREKIQFAFTPQKTATAARFARSGGPSGPGGGGKGPGSRGGADDQAGRGFNDGRGPGDGGPPGGRGPGMGPGGGFIGEQYGQAVWSNFPVSDVPRSGVNLGSLSTAQRDAAMHMMQVVLSPKGYQKVQEIMGSDQALSDGDTLFSSGIKASPSASSGNRASLRRGCWSMAAIISP